MIYMIYIYIYQKSIDEVRPWAYIYIQHIHIYMLNVYMHTLHQYHGSLPVYRQEHLSTAVLHSWQVVRASLMVQLEESARKW